MMPGDQRSAPLPAMAPRPSGGHVTNVAARQDNPGSDDHRLPPEGMGSP
ncbi:hypothetical protein I545_3344 [Mycobacterium kansasii 662]|uniref:Uncharacterized protein n=1 Tax=Mycobacterium kansasii 662 TaxID=1299326 RepID=X7ZDN9_MYCKA|nr:hypothetical protein I545_3344 [Mycobacterium kansasii 662]